jgi:hypothetical protein
MVISQGFLKQQQNINGKLEDKMRKIFNPTLVQIVISLLVFLLFYSVILFFAGSSFGYFQENKKADTLDLSNLFGFVEFISTTSLVYISIWILLSFVLLKRKLINEFSFSFLLVCFTMILLWLIISKLKII